jgi:RNA polymerase sigma factor (sigma-70 family)
MKVTESERRRLVRLCAVLSGDRCAAEDLAQETLLEAWRNLHKLYDARGAEPWLAAIARNVCRRWAHRRGRELAVVPLDVDVAADDLDNALDHDELTELLDRALSVLPPETREILVHRYVHETPTAEIGGRFGLSPDAVSMRLARGREALRRVLADEAACEGWHRTRVWCDCGQARLELLRQSAPERVTFRCPACTTQAAASAFRLENPVFARLLDGLVRPTAILRRTAEWAQQYFAAGVGGTVDCTRCGRAVPLRRYVRDRDGLRSDGLFAACPGCGEQVSSSIRGLFVGIPEVRRFRREHSRSRTLPQRELAFAGRAAIVVRHENMLGSAGVDVVFSRDTLRMLHVAAA